jgi:hypothetical protein
VKPVVAIDMDGTLGDYHGHFIRFAAQWIGDDEAVLRCSLDMYNGSIPFKDYFCARFYCSVTTYRQIKLAYRQGGMKRSMPPYRGAKAACDMVTKAGGELWITTTRPYLSFDTILPDTLEWFDRQQIGFDHLIFDADKYAVLADRVDSGRVVAVLDDLPEMYDAAEEHFGDEVPILISNPYNWKVVRRYREPLIDATTIVRRRILQWKEQHAGTN